jgi:DNA (cytosine-5)-methyltransferase 1
MGAFPCRAAPGAADGGARLIVLDGCCGGGGAARGYVQAGHQVIGVDREARFEHDYLHSGAGEFITMDILTALSDRRLLASVDFVHVSPPCQYYSQMSRCRPGLAAAYPDLIGPVRDQLERAGKPYVIENVEAAGPWMKNPTMLCCWMFGRMAYRHRLFEAGGGLVLPAPPRTPDGLSWIGRVRDCGWPHPVPAAKAGHWQPGYFVSVSGHERREPVRRVMEIDWMASREDVAEAVPPYFTEWVGSHL